MVYLFLSDISDVDYELDFSSFSPSRREYVESFSDLYRKNQSIAVWKLLEYALKKTCSMKKIEGFSDLRGKWLVENFSGDISLSHSRNIVAVALTKKGSVGVDVEVYSKKILRLEEKFKVREDFSELEKIKFLTKQWTKQESEYKCKNAKNTRDFTVKDVEGKRYIISLSQSKKRRVKVTNVPFSEIE